jgi:dienelactone hydrolase
MREPHGLVALECTLPAGSGDDRAGSGGGTPATLYRPVEAIAPLPGWIVLHGITRPGRFHPVLVRFARALASTGAAVLVPEVAAWVELRLAPDRVLPTVRRALARLDAEPGVAPGPRGLVGFSFGAPQAVRVGAALGGDIAAIVAWGGYRDLTRTLRFQFTGEHEWRGVGHKARPDPYGRWIVAGNYLTGVPGYEAARPVAAGLLELARIAGERRVPAWHAGYDLEKDRIAASLAPDQRALFRQFAPPSSSDPLPPTPDVLAWPERLAEAGRRQDPLVDPIDRVDALGAPVHVLHGREDRLIPWSEGLRLAEALEDRGQVHTTVTGLFAHADEHTLRRTAGAAVDGVRFLRALGRVLGEV